MGKNYGGTQTGQDNSTNKQHYMANTFVSGPNLPLTAVRSKLKPELAIRVEGGR